MMAVVVFGVMSVLGGWGLTRERSWLAGLLGGLLALAIYALPVALFIR